MAGHAACGGVAQRLHEAGRQRWGTGGRQGRARQVARQRKGQDAMNGVIKGRDVLANLALVWREFGTACVLRCLRALLTGRRTTFLACAFAREEE